ncbi:MAG: lysine--tRNA ligase [Anaerolineae bacterium]|nr:lysine--tRNA ligase [Anaerolineae bacterium]
MTDQELVRRAKAQRLRAQGQDPYPPRCERTHTIAEARHGYENGEIANNHAVSLAGRLISIRIMGRASFAHLEDGTGRIQLFFRKDALGDASYEAFKGDLDLGDFVGATGTLFTTKTGEVTVSVERWQLLAKAMHPLPDKWHGLKDVETRYRQRYVDLLVNPDVRRVFVTRARLIAALRRFLDSRGFLEVETPILQPIYGGAAAKPFMTHHNPLDQDLYLRISFELYLKRLLVGGYERVYEIGRDFRNEGVSFKHNPEFTQLEFYQAYADYNEVMRITEEMIAYVADEVLGTRRITYQEHEIDLSPPWPRLALRRAILERTGIDYDQHPTAEGLYQAIRAIGGNVEPKATRGKLIDALLSNYVEPHLIQPTFLTDYPLEVSPLAKMKPGHPDTVERFEGFVGGMEICNAFSELNDPEDQEARFIAMGRDAAAGDEEAHPMDDDFLRALRYGMPPTGGFGMGIDRLTMLLTNQASIREVILFPHLRSKE